MKRYLLALIGCLQTVLTAGQVADSIALNEVQVLDTRIPKIVGSKTSELDSSLIANSADSDLSGLLGTISGFALRTYGFSGTANVSLRGAGPQHTLLLWNGVPINDAMLGQADASSVPVSIGDEIEVLYGPAAMIHQPGGIGGAISLSPSFMDNDGVNAQISAGYGSFNMYSGSASVKARVGKWASNTSASYRWAKNDFPFVNIATHDERIHTTSNAMVEQIGLQHSSLVKIDKANSFQVSVLGSRTDRELPPTMLQASSEESLTDLDAVGAIKWRHLRERSELSVQLSYICGNQQYSRTDTSYQFNHLFQTGRLFLRYDLALRNNLKLRLGLDGSAEHARSDSAYRYMPRSRFSEALFASVSYYPVRSLGLQLLIREDLIDQKFSPIQWSFGTNWNALKWLVVKGNFSRNYKMPGLNDLYWQPGGNPDLDPENGLSYEAGLKLAHKWGKGSSIWAEVTWFDSWINNMIIWLPGGGSLWSLQNKRQVRANGIETSKGFQLRKGNWSFSTSGNYSWIRSTITRSYFEADEAIGKQTLYTPEHEAGLRISGSWKTISLTYGQIAVGRRPTTSDNETWLEAYTLGWVQLDASLPIKRNRIGIGLRLHNLWNTQYQQIAWRPMPGFNYSIKLKYTFS